MPGCRMQGWEVSTLVQFSIALLSLWAGLGVALL